MNYVHKKSLGQHFLHDEDMCRNIVAQTSRREGLQLLEVGPGAGALTKYLLQWPEVSYKAVEIDAEKIAYLEHELPAIRGKLIHEDVLKMAAPFEGMFSVIGNFPYNISTQILFRVLDWEEHTEEVVGMFQKEVAQRIASGPGSKAYGILSVMLQAFYHIEYLYDVPPESFTPAPKVMSGVLKLTRTGNPYGVAHKKPFLRLIKAAFGQRRKVLGNSLKGTLPPEALNTDLMKKRAEQLSVQQFVDLYNEWMLPG